jgi:hypothetical protein
MPKAHRHLRAAKRNPPPKPAAEEYVITDPNHKPDLRGQFGGQPVYQRGLVQYVRLTPSQAKFYLSSGSIKPSNPASKASHAMPRKTNKHLN